MKKTVYFLGAGASLGSDFHLPTMKGFFREQDLKDNQYARLKNFIDRRYPNTPYSEINMEDVITHLELSLEGFGSNWDPSKLEELEAKGQFFDYILQRFSIEPDKSCNKYLKLLKDLSDDEDTMISLNYDLIVERALKTLGNEKKNYLDRSQKLSAYQFLLWGGIDPIVKEDAVKGLFLKLHGSLDWVSCPNSACFLNQQFYPVAEFAKEPCAACGTPVQFVIVPPTMKKSYDQFPKLKLIWHLAFKKLQQADRLILIGMSLPDSDYYLRWLLKESMSKRKTLPELTIVNPDESVMHKTKDILGIKDVQWFDSLDKYINNIP
jgi:hypothetical protein